ncbi:MAG: hypothetical protein IPJ37_03980 [Bacteroidales bacterium]|nr:hypothetical protein [Bacteroidales bacterium]
MKLIPYQKSPQVDNRIYVSHAGLVIKRDLFLPVYASVESKVLLAVKKVNNGGILIIQVF